MEVLPHHDGPGVQRTHEGLDDELVGSGRGPLGVEVDDVGHLDAVGREQFELVVERGEQPWRALGAKHIGRVRVEGDDRRQHAEARRLGPELAQDVLMAEVHSVEHTDADRRLHAHRQPVGPIPQNLHAGDATAHDRR